MSITKRSFGKTTDGIEVYIYTLSNSKGTKVEITNLGGTITSLEVPDRKGKFHDVVLGYDKPENYAKGTSYFGAIIGRHANRIGNACFELNGVEYKLAKNDGENHLHGGIKGFDKAVWSVSEKEKQNSLILTYFSKDNEEGYPGNLIVKVTYTLTEDDAISIEYFAISDKDTVVNLTNHSYFNLSGHSSENILKHKVMINADKFTVNDNHSIPTGEIKDVNNTPMDFRKPTEVGENIDSQYEQIVFGGGYDHNWVLNVSGRDLEKAAEVYDDNSGRVMEVFTTMPGVQFYTGNFIDSSVPGKGGVTYGKRNGLCLETQYFPNALNRNNFPSPILKAGEEYRHTTIYKFSVR